MQKYPTRLKKMGYLALIFSHMPKADHFFSTSVLFEDPGKLVCLIANFSLKYA